jgi:hypothetical protein
MAEGSLVESLVSGRERRALGRASHRGHGGHRGGIEGWMAEGSLVVSLVFGARKTRIGQSIAQRSRRSQRGD